MLFCLDGQQHGRTICLKAYLGTKRLLLLYLYKTLPRLEGLDLFSSTHTPKLSITGMPKGNNGMEDDEDENIGQTKVGGKPHNLST
jgi:hypothetical protein